MSVPVAKIRMFDDPFLLDPSNANDFYLAAGRYMMVWGNLECHFNYALFFMMSMRGARVLLNHVKQETPASLKVKAEAWKRIVGRHPALSPIKQDALQFVCELLDASQKRNDLIHSAWEDFVSSEPLVIRMENMSWKGGKAGIVINHVAIEQIEEMTTVASKLNTRLTAITKSVLASNQRPSTARKSERPKPNP